MGESRGVYRVFVGKPERKRPLGRLRHRWEDNIKVNLKEMVFGSSDWISLTQDMDSYRALVKAVMTFRVSCNMGNFLTS